MRSRRYCARCGEECEEALLCDGCGQEFCENCGTAAEFQTETCCKCRNAREEDKRQAEKRVTVSRCLPGMREWAMRNL
jgi:hypothetical protein